MKPLLSGLDTVECAYYLRPTALCAIDFRHLAIEKEVLRQSKKREPRKIEIGGIDFFLQPYGSGSGYPFLIENENMSIEFGEFNEPSFYRTYRSIALWHKGRLHFTSNSSTGRSVSASSPHRAKACREWISSLITSCRRSISGTTILCHCQRRIASTARIGKYKPSRSAKAT
jgi:hypothetical protein